MLCSLLTILDWEFDIIVKRLIYREVTVPLGFRMQIT